jgi:two-component system response regulator RegX3
VAERTCVFLVDDDPGVTDALGTALVAEGFAVAVVHTGEKALEMFDGVKPEIVLLDLVLPGISGSQVCRRLRAKSKVPILMISGRSGEHEVIESLDAGADDYLVKPFGVHELVARVRAALRRGPVGEVGAASDTVEVGDLTLETRSARAWLAGRELALAAKEYNLLETLARNAGRVVHRDALVAEAWGPDERVSKKTIDSRIRRLREKLQGADGGSRIQTVRGVGFRYEGPHSSEAG